MLDFSFMGIEYGFLTIKIQSDYKYVIWTFDECLSDPIPGMMRMYNTLKEGKNASWKIRGDYGSISFHTEFRDGNKEAVWLIVQIEEDFCEPIIAEEKFSVDTLLVKFETFFRFLTTSRLYPCHYPCWSDQAEDDSGYDEAEKIKERYPGIDRKELHQLKLLCFAQHCTLTETGEELYRKFDNMMRTHKVPDEWK